MPNLLLQSCSASKQEVDNPLPAFELYSGYFYRILKKAIRDDEFRSDVDINILSAEHGLIKPSDEIAPYDRRMDRKRAEALNPTVLDSIETRVGQDNYERIIVNMGETYRGAVTGLEHRVDATIAEIQGDGIGEKGNALYRFIRGDESAVNPSDSL